jgi:hypothetical protein
MTDTLSVFLRCRALARAAMAAAASSPPPQRAAGAAAAAREAAMLALFTPSQAAIILGVLDRLPPASERVVLRSRVTCPAS